MRFHYVCVFRNLKKLKCFIDYDIAYNLYVCTELVHLSIYRADCLYNVAIAIKNTPSIRKFSLRACFWMDNKQLTDNNINSYILEHLPSSLLSLKIISGDFSSKSLPLFQRFTHLQKVLLRPMNMINIKLELDENAPWIKEPWNFPDLEANFE